MDKNEKYQQGKKIVIEEHGWTYGKFKSLVSKCLTHPIQITDRIWFNCYQTYVYSSSDKFMYPVDWAKHYYGLYEEHLDRTQLKADRDLHRYYNLDGFLYVSEDELTDIGKERFN